MISDGMPYIRMKHAGKKCKYFFCIIAILLMLCGCRGDWSIQLINGYSIDRINSREVCLCYKENPNSSRSTCVMYCYYITAYQVQEQYILLEGISTEESAATDKELESEERIYYYIDTVDHTISNPIQSKELLHDCCEELSIPISDLWIEAK